MIGNSLYGRLILAALTICMSASTAYAGEWDERGKLSLENSDYSYGFDTRAGEEDFRLIAFGPRGETSFDADAFVQAPDGLEGEGHLSVGGRVVQMLMSLGDNLDRFQGRRVQMNLWYKPDGTDVDVSMSWVTGDVDGYITGTSQDIVIVAKLALFPTGRATSDGWVELSTGPFDYEAAGVSPAWIAVRDSQYIQSYRRAPLDSDARVLLDALEIEDLGPAQQTGAACNGWTEADACGAGGECLMGRCVDAAIVTGGAPAGQVREDYVARLLHEIDTFQGVRQGRARLDEITQRLGALADVSAQDFWREIGLAHELLVDGHGSPPSARSFAIYHTSGICLGPGEADLLPGQGGVEAGPVPMVFSTNSARFPTSAVIQTGDVLTHIDDQPVKDWIERQRHQLYYNGDVRGRDAILTRDLMSKIKQLGSRVTFSRCVSTEGAACAPEDVQEIEIDFSAILGEPVWMGTPPENFYDYVDECDFRFERPVDMPPNTYAYYFAGYNDIEGIRHVLINGVPETQSQYGDQWARNIRSALEQVDQPILLDQRTGYGGTIDSLALIVGYFLESSNKATSVFLPWVGEELDGELLEAFEACAESANGPTQECGLYYSVTPTDFFQSGAASQERLAVLNGFDVSGNDYLPRFLQFRAAETRQFGYGPTFGAFGQSCSLPSHLSGVRGMAYQCHDSLFKATPDGADSGFESGYGVMPDVLVYQKQSDAVAGKDTMLEAARAWLKEEPAVVTP